MDKFNQLPHTIKTLIILTVVILAYSYLCRLFEIYFFWESMILGWTLLIVSIIGLLQLRIQTKKAQDKKTTSEKIFTGILLFVITFTFGWFILVPQMDSYKVAKEYLLTDKYISNEIGEVSSIVLLPAGSISTSSRSAGTTGQAELNFIVKGKLKFKDINVQLYKKVNSDWTIYKP